MIYEVKKLLTSPFKESALSIQFLLLLTLLFFWRVPVQGKVLLPLDVLHTYEPWRSEVPGAFGIQIWSPWLTDAIRQYYPLQSQVQSAWQQGYGSLLEYLRVNRNA